MPQLIQQDASLTVFRVRLSADASAAAAVARAPGNAASAAAVPEQRIACELVLRGNTEERGFAGADAGVSSPSPSRRRTSSSRPTYERCEAELPASTTRTVAHWSISPEELQLPVDYRSAVRFRDKPNAASAWLGDFARFAATRLLSDSRADTLERFASSRQWLPSGRPTLPSSMLRQLQGLLQFALRGSDCLWLEIADPTGYLPLLPWEELLGGATDAPVLRLSPHPVQAWYPARGLAVVTCISAPSPNLVPKAEDLGALLQAVRDALPENSVIHVFADDLCRESVSPAGAGWAGEDKLRRAITVHELPEARTDATDANEPWSTWIATSLAGRAVDIFHSISPGFLFADNARLVIARDPRAAAPDRGAQGMVSKLIGRPLRYATPAELSDLLTRFGAWATVFSTPLRGADAFRTRPGLRLLVDQIARLRPGVAAFHDAEDDPGFSVLKNTMAFIIGDASVKARASRAVAVYCHAARAVRTEPLPAALSPDLLDQYTRVRATLDEAVARDGSLPAWVASTQRILELALSRATQPSGPRDESVMRGLSSAIKLVDQLVARTSAPAAPPAVEAPPTERRGAQDG